MNIVLHKPGGMSAGRFKVYIPTEYVSSTPDGDYLTCRRSKATDRSRIWNVTNRAGTVVHFGTLAECKRFMERR